jgi:hypothetical protein
VKPPASGAEPTPLSSPAQLSLAVMVPESAVASPVESSAMSALVAVDVTVVVCTDASVRDLAVSVERLHVDNASKNKSTILDESSPPLPGLMRTGVHKARLGL